MVATRLLRKDEVAYRRGQLLTLPVSFGDARMTVISRGRRDGLDRVRGGTQVVFSHMTDTGGLASRVRSESSCAAKRSSCCHGVTAAGSCRHHAQFAVRPGASCLDRLPRPAVARGLLDEQVQNVFGASRRPASK